MIEGSFLKNDNYKIVADNLEDIWSPTGLDTCRRVSKELYKLFLTDFTVKSSSVYEYTKDVRKKFYGNPANGDYGEKGCSEYVFCKEVNGRYEYLNEREE
jgi:hypothetical protein